MVGPPSTLNKLRVSPSLRAIFLKKTKFKNLGPRDKLASLEAEAS